MKMAPSFYALVAAVIRSTDRIPYVYGVLCVDKLVVVNGSLLIIAEFEGSLVEGDVSAELDGYVLKLVAFVNELCKACELLSGCENVLLSNVSCVKPCGICCAVPNVNNCLDLGLYSLKSCSLTCEIEYFCGKTCCVSDLLDLCGCKNICCCGTDLCIIDLNAVIAFSGMLTVNGIKISVRNVVSTI